ncbi:hypothetical protein Taro_037454, partial [Colocasia esculenta]|nr:hypothetical protein [Colocasia esculenta]
MLAIAFRWSVGNEDLGLLFLTGSFRDPERTLLAIRYNQFVDHMGTHGQRRLTEALNKDSLVRQKEYPTESLSKSRESVYRNKCSMFQRNSKTVER